MERFAIYGADDVFVGTADDLGWAQVAAAPDGKIRERKIKMIATPQGYVGVVYDGVETPKPIKGTESNAALICRSKSIDTAARLGLRFSE